MTIVVAFVQFFLQFLVYSGVLLTGTHEGG